MRGVLTVNLEPGVFNQMEAFSIRPFAFLASCGCVFVLTSNDLVSSLASSRPGPRAGVPDFRNLY